MRPACKGGHGPGEQIALHSGFQILYLLKVILWTGFLSPFILPRQVEILSSIRFIVFKGLVGFLRRALLHRLPVGNPLIPAAVQLPRHKGGIGVQSGCLTAGLLPAAMGILRPPHSLLLCRYVHFIACKHAQPQLTLADPQPGTVPHAQVFLRFRHGDLIHGKIVLPNGRHHKAPAVIIAEPQVAAGHTGHRNAKIVGAHIPQRSFKRHREHLTCLQVACSLRDYQLADIACIRQKPQAFFALAALPGIPPVAAPDDENHQKQKPESCRQSDNFINLDRHQSSSWALLSARDFSSLRFTRCKALSILFTWRPSISAIS